MLLASFSLWDSSLHNWISGFGAPVEDLARLIIAAIAGGLVGLEREVRGRQAGFRTYLLVCLGSALVMLVSIQFAEHPWLAQTKNQGVNINVDPARIAYSIMTGIGFLGAGVIIHNRGSVHGLTTAAGLWCIAAVGMAAGFGMYTVTMMATLLILMTLWFLNYVEEWIPRVHERVVTIRIAWKPGCVEAAARSFTDAGLAVKDVNFDRSRDPHYADIHLRIAFMHQKQFYDFEQQLQTRTDYELIAMEEL